MADRIGPMFRAIVLISTLSTCPALAADNFVAAADVGTANIDFDTMDYHFSQFRLPNIGTLNALRTVIHIDRLGSDPRTAPAVGIHLLGDSNGNEIQLRFWSVANASITAKLIRFESGKSAVEIDFHQAFKLAQNIDVAMNWTPDGKVVALVGGELLTLDLAQPISSLLLTGTTCEGQFTPFKIGRASFEAIPDPQPSPQ